MATRTDPLNLCGVKLAPHQRLPGSVALVLLTVSFWQTCLCPVRGGENEAANGLIGRIRSNETLASSVIVEGTFEHTRYEVSGQVDYNVVSSFRFLRSGPLIKIERHASHFSRTARAPLEGSGDSTTTKEFFYYSPQSSTRVNLDIGIAYVDPPDSPALFPLIFGYWLRPVGDVGTIKRFSEDLEQALKDDTLQSRQDSENPDLTILEFVHPLTPNRMQFWVDRSRGFIITKMRWLIIPPEHPALPSPPQVRQGILMHEQQATPKLFGDCWFIERGTDKKYVINPLWRDGGALTYLAVEEKINVTNFLCGVSLKPSQLEFSTNAHPDIKIIYDEIRKEKIDVRTGERSPLSREPVR